MRRKSSRTKARRERLFNAVCYCGVAVQLIAASVGALAVFSNFPN
jgi:hypothetical protein